MRSVSSQKGNFLEELIFKLLNLIFKISHSMFYMNGNNSESNFSFLFLFSAYFLFIFWLLSKHLIDWSLSQKDAGWLLIEWEPASQLVDQFNNRLPALALLVTKKATHRPPHCSYFHTAPIQEQEDRCYSMLFIKWLRREKISCFILLFPIHCYFLFDFEILFIEFL